MEVSFKIPKKVIKAVLNSDGLRNSPFSNFLFYFNQFRNRFQTPIKII